jgi:alanine racemase
VKADAYGLGAARVVPILAQAGCRDWFVAHWCEVPDLLPHVPPASIHVLHGPMNAADVAYARATGVSRCSIRSPKCSAGAKRAAACVI